ncbi:YceI family protein [Alicyclobacillus tolerans]|uniref:YceI family protein n=1 Tax=Alicyclobacillus tolerans TaxID=90970 RepID=UPI001F36A9E2|nr:YceI family protein [Alicyclobacillus tolerans]MCF8564252.1 YceI family protein [Alicyclobacillus tolerans]
MALQKWAVDAAHSEVDFSIKHMMFAKVKGGFNSFEASIEADPEDLTTANIEFSVDVASVDTRNDDRDNHLRSGDFFDAENHPKMTFKSAKITKKSDGQYDVTGDLTIHGVTRPETFVVTYGGKGQDPWGNERVAFSAEGKINRSDYGLTWNAALEMGGVLVGDDVQISIELQAVKA